MLAICDFIRTCHLKIYNFVKIVAIIYETQDIAGKNKTLSVFTEEHRELLFLKYIHIVFNFSERWCSPLLHVTYPYRWVHTDF
jgi:hypothetical protein